MSIITNQTETLKTAILPGKYTLLSVSDGMAMTQRAEVEICEVKDGGDYAQYRQTTMIVFKPKGKRIKYQRRAKTSDLFLKGWNLPIRADTDRDGNGCFILRGNALINLVGDYAGIINTINAAFVYGNKAICVYVNPSEGEADETPLFPELAREQGHAVLNRIMDRSAA